MSWTSDFNYYGFTRSVSILFSHSLTDCIFVSSGLSALQMPQLLAAAAAALQNNPGKIIVYKCDMQGVTCCHTCVVLYTLTIMFTPF